MESTVRMTAVKVYLHLSTYWPLEVCAIQMFGVIDLLLWTTSRLSGLSQLTTAKRQWESLLRF